MGHGLALLLLIPNSNYPYNYTVASSYIYRDIKRVASISIEKNHFYEEQIISFGMRYDRTKFSLYLNNLIHFGSFFIMPEISILITNGHPQPYKNNYSCLKIKAGHIYKNVSYYLTAGKTSKTIYSTVGIGTKYSFDKIDFSLEYYNEYYDSNLVEIQKNLKLNTEFHF